MEMGTVFSDILKREPTIILKLLCRELKCCKINGKKREKFVDEILQKVPQGFVLKYMGSAEPPLQDGVEPLPLRQSTRIRRSVIRFETSQNATESNEESIVGRRRRSTAPPPAPTPPPPTKRKTILIQYRTVKKNKVRQDYLEKDCPICLEKKSYIYTQCKHTFCSCIIKVISQNMNTVHTTQSTNNTCNCPYCRTLIYSLTFIHKEYYDFFKNVDPIWARFTPIKVEKVSSPVPVVPPPLHPPTDSEMVTIIPSP
jgi:hypothetical protein